MKDTGLIPKDSVGAWLQAAGMIVVGLLCLGYALASSVFAKLHLTIPGLNFPIFIGEIAFFVCAVIYMALRLRERRSPDRGEWILITGLIFILLKAALGYVQYGPLAFRHAALFYYGFFGLFCYRYFNPELLTPARRMGIIAVLIVCLALRLVTREALLTVVLSGIALILTLPDRRSRWMLLAVWLAAVHHKVFFYNARTYMLANFGAGFFLIVVLSFWRRWKPMFRAGALVLMMTVLVGATAVFAHRDDVRSMIDLSPVVHRYRELKDQIVSSGQYFSRPPEVILRLYQEDDSVPQVRLQPVYDRVYGQVDGKNTEEIYLADYYMAPLQDGLLVKYGPRERLAMTFAEYQSYRSSNVPAAQLTNKDAEKLLHDMAATEDPGAANGQEKPKHSGPDEYLAPKIPAEREADISTSYTNILFRIFIWEDLVRDIVSSWKNVWGFPFGKPFLSNNLIVLQWASEIWETDGWICAHNSYLEILYRSGLLGVVLIFWVFYRLCMLVRAFFRRSLPGILLCAALLGWLIASCFAVVLEVPYSAIMFWSLLGVAGAYARHQALTYARSAHP